MSCCLIVGVATCYVDSGHVCCSCYGAELVINYFIAFLAYYIILLFLFKVRIKRKIRYFFFVNSENTSKCNFIRETGVISIIYKVKIYKL